METLRLDLHTFDPAATADDPAAFVRLATDFVISSWHNGADIVVLPEFMWMGLERFVSSSDKIRGVADLFWNHLWPGIAETLHHPSKAVVLGTVPFIDGNHVRNRAPIINCGHCFHQDKIHLTPWEEVFTGGGPLRVWKFGGIRVAVLICLDVEIPEISAALRGHDLDLLLVPSATESLAGVERVGRCASARAVELGCHVGLCHLTGNTTSHLIDTNIGRLAVHSPSQNSFPSTGITTELFETGFHTLSTTLDIAAIRRNRTDTSETDPSKIAPAPIRISTEAPD